MYFFKESSEKTVIDWSWEDNGKYPIINFKAFVFDGDFKVTEGEDTLVENVDYLVIIKSNKVYMRYGLLVFGGIVLLSTDSRELKITYRKSSDNDIQLPTSTSSPYSVGLDDLDAPYTDSHNSLISIIDEITGMVPFMEGNVLPINMIINLYKPKYELINLMKVSIAYDLGEVLSTAPSQVERYQYPLRSDFISGADIPLDLVI